MRFTKKDHGDFAYRLRMERIDNRFSDCPFCKKPAERIMFADEPTYKHRVRMTSPNGKKFIKSTYCKGNDGGIEGA